MEIPATVRISLATLVLLAFGIPHAAANPLEDMMREFGGAEESPPMAMDPEQMPDIVPLTERDVTDFIDVARRLEALGLDLDADDDLFDGADAIAQNRQAMDVLESGGFDISRFLEVTYSIAMAMAAMETEQEVGDLQAFRQEQEAEMAAMMSELRGQLPPEMMQMFEQQMDMAGGLMDQLANQPPQNIELARQYRDELGDLMQVEGMADEDFDW